MFNWFTYFVQIAIKSLRFKCATQANSFFDLFIISELSVNYIENDQFSDISNFISFALFAKVTVYVESGFMY